jgi:hypothetical protein
VIKFDYLSTDLLSFSLNGSTSEYEYSSQLHNENSAYTPCDNEYSFLRSFLISYLNKFNTTLFIQLLLQANPTRLLKVKLLGDLLSHLLQELRVLLVRAVGG